MRDERTSSVKKIAVITSHPIQYQAPLFRAIARQPDIDLTVFFGSNHGIAPGKVDPGFGKSFAWDVSLLDGYKHIFLNNSRPGREVNDWRLDAPDLKSYFKSERYDAVLVFGWSKVLFWQAIWWARKYSIPLIQRGESNLKHAQSWYVKAAKKILFPLLFKQFKAFLAIGRLNAELYRHFGVPEAAIFTAPYCVDNDFFSERAAAQTVNARQLRKDFGIRDDDTVFLFMAKFIDRKRPLDLIAAAAKIHAAGNRHVILVGDGALLETCRNTIAADKLTNVHLVGFKNQSELPTYYAAADVLVLPSEYETWGLVVNEAMACGLPCIVSDACGAAADMILEGKTGFTYP
ncbi:MAG: glycosyltransferase family 4 protein, partial [Sulfuricaulis sp.]|nr:glycosyltransferase family 4 protein [Sulfuricaulis sp.]